MSARQDNSRVPERTETERLSSSSASLDETPLIYATDVQIVVESGDVHLIFTRLLALEAGADEPKRPTAAGQPESEVIARVVLSPPAAHRLLRLLPARLTDQLASATSVRDETDDFKNDPFLAALAAAELDDEPYTDEQRAAALAGWEACRRGETVSWEDVRRALLDETESSKISTS